MAEENQTQKKEPTLEDRLLNIGSLHRIAEGIRTTNNPQERFDLYRDLTNLVSENAKDYDDNWGDIRVSPEEAIRYAIEGISTREKEAKPLYEKEKSRIIDEVINAIEVEVKSAKDKADAASKIAPYLSSLFKIQELDQVTADMYARTEVARRSGVRMNYTAHGRLSDYKEDHKNLQLRLMASQYLEDVKDDKDNIISYKLNKGKIKELMESGVEYTAIIYKNAKDIEAIKAELGMQKEKK